MQHVEDRWLEPARALLAEHPAVDLHTDTIEHALRGAELARVDRAHASPERLRAGGFGLCVYAFWIPAHLGPTRGWERACGMMEALERERETLNEAATVTPLQLVPALEDARVLVGHPERVSAIARWGVVYVTLTWNNGNAWATSCEDTRVGLGLTDGGRDLVSRLDAGGIRVDVSHLSDRAARDVIAHASLPPIASHSSARAIHHHSRNVSDDLARAIADRGGVVGVNVHRHFLAMARADANLDAVIAHIEYLWKVAGEEGVAFGSDFDGIPEGPDGLEGAERFPVLISRLLERGHSPERIARFARTNALRALGRMNAPEGTGSISATPTRHA